MRSVRHLICSGCLIDRRAFCDKPTAEELPVREDSMKDFPDRGPRCCFCGEKTTRGAYIRANPDRIFCNCSVTGD